MRGSGHRYVSMYGNCFGERYIDDRYSERERVRERDTSRERERY